MLTVGDIEDAAQRLGGQVVRTACTRSATLSKLLGCELYIKFENQQFTASFKERGALNCLLQLEEAAKRTGVIAMSAGNHAQALAYHAERLGIPATIVMPRATPNAKVEQTRVFNAEVILKGAEFEETRVFTEELAASRGLSIVHPYDDPRVVAGQGTLALEMLEQVDALDAVLVPIGGGGLIAGVATLVKARAPACEVIGVQVERFSGAHAAFHGVEIANAHNTTVAEGIAVRSPGAAGAVALRDHVDDVVTVAEEEVEQAILSLLEIEKTVAEGAGAAGLAAVTAARERFENRRVGIVVTGGNVDMMVLSSVLQRGLVRSNRLVRLHVEIPDVPGALADLTTRLGRLNSNIVDIVHQRAFGASSARATLVELVLQMRGEEQIDAVLDDLRDGGYAAKLGVTP